MIRYEELPLLMVVYGLGFMAIFALLAAMYLRGWKRRAALGVSDAAGRHFLDQAGHCLVYVAVGGLSTLMALVGGPKWTGWSGVAYGLIGPLQAVYHAVLTRRARAAPVTPTGRGSAPR